MHVRREQRGPPGWDVDPSAVAHDGCLGAAIVEIDLVTTWGEGGKPVYWLGETPDYSGQQAAPKPGRGDMWASLIERVESRRLAPPHIIDLMKARRQLGIERYGAPLQAGNGRDAVREAIEETLDQMAYLEQVLYEHNDARLHSEIRAAQASGLEVLVVLVGLANRGQG